MKQKQTERLRQKEIRKRTSKYKAEENTSGQEMDMVLYDRAFAQEQCVRFDLPLRTGYGREDFTKSPNENFYIKKNIGIVCTPLQPSLCLYPRHFLDIKNLSHQTNSQCGGIRRNVVVKGFHSRRYTKLVKALLQNNQDALGVSPVGVSRKAMKKRIDKCYTQEFRGKTAITQVVAAEWCAAKHLHTGRPRGSHCHKCRLKTELDYLVRVRLLTKIGA